MNKKRLIVGLTLALFTLLLSACGSKEAGTAEAPKSNGTENVGVLGTIKSSGTINIGIEGAYPPFNYYDDKNELVGFDVDITNELAKRMGVKANFVATPWDSIIAGLLSKKYDIILSSMAITDARKQKVDFTDPYYHTGAQLFIPTSSAITNPTDINGRKIGASIGTTFEKKANELGAVLVTYKNDMLSFQDMASGRVEGVITDRGVGARMIKEHQYPFKPIGEPLLKDAAGIALNKNEDALREELNKYLGEMLKDGTYEQISKKWFDQDIR